MRDADWKNLLHGAFAGMTAPFAVHPLDGKRARRMFHAAMNAGATLEDILGEADRFLRKQGCTKNYIAEQTRRIRQYPHNPRKKLKSKRAWLITWQGINFTEKVVAILSSRKSAETVAHFTEQYYIASTYSISEKITYAKSSKDNPYRVEFDDINGVPWSGRMTCGHNPFLVARIVTNLAVISDGDGNEKLVWEEQKKPKN